MTIIIKDTDFRELCEESWQKGETAYYQNGAEVRGELPPQFGRGCHQFIQLRNGLDIHIINGELWHPLNLDRQHDEWSSFISKFYLSGNSRVITPEVKGVKDDYEEISGHNYLYYLPEIREFEQWPAGEQIQVVMVYVELDFLRSFSQGLESLPEKLRQLIAGDCVQRFHQSLGLIRLTAVWR